MISWIATVALALIVIRIVWVEVKFGRRSNTALASTNEQIESIKRNVTEKYREKYGKDPTSQFPLVDVPKTAAKRS